MAAGSLKPFYVALGAIAVIGGVLIARQTMGRGGAATLSLEPAGGPPVAVGPRGVTMGSDSARIEITEFADFECPWCARFAVMTLPDVRRQLVETGRIRWRFVHFPLSIHRASPYAHLAAACANEQSRFWPMSDQIYNDQADWVASRRPDRKLRDIAQRVGLDMSRYDNCIKNQTAWPQVLADKALGDSVGLDGTPTFLVNGHIVRENLPSSDRWLAIVDSVAQAMAAAAQPPAPARPPRS